MSRYFALVLFGLSLAIPAVAQPVLRTNYPVLNSGSYMTPGMPGSGIAQGSEFALFGSGLGPSGAAAQSTTFPLTTELGGTSVAITVGGTTTHALMLNVFYGQQINALLPSATPVGTGTITVTYAGVTSAPAAIQVVSSAFGIFAANSAADGQAAATDIAYNKNSIIHTYHPGDVAILWGTGLGPVGWDETKDPSTVGDFSQSLPAPTQVYVGSSTAATGYHGRSGCCAGLDQVVFTVPAGVKGCFVPVAVQVGGALSNITTIAVSDAGQTCDDSPLGPDLVAKLASGQDVSFGYIRLEGGAYIGGDGGFATFNRFTPDAASMISFAPSPGYCMAVDCSNGCWSNGGLSLTDLTFPNLDAGPSMSLMGSVGAATLTQAYAGFGLYFNPNLGNGSRYLWGGTNVAVSNGTGGPGVGPILVTDKINGVASPFTNIVFYQNIPKAADLNVTWDGSVFPQPNGQVTIGAVSFSEGNTQDVLLQCTAPAAANQFTIPGWILGQLPVSGKSGGAYPRGFMWIGQYNTPTTFTARGLDKGIITDATFYLRQVTFK